MLAIGNRLLESHFDGVAGNRTLFDSKTIEETVGNVVLQIISSLVERRMGVDRTEVDGNLMVVVGVLVTVESGRRNQLEHKGCFL